MLLIKQIIESVDNWHHSMAEMCHLIHSILLTQADSASENRALVEGILPFEWDLQFMGWNFLLQSTQLIIVAEKA